VKGAQGGAPALTADGACTEDQRATICRAFVDARQMTNASIAALTLEPEATRPHLVRFFGTNPAGAIAKNFREISRGLDERESRIRYECNRASDCRGATFAYAGRNGRGTEVMGFCPTFFRAARTGQDSQGGIVIHEMSHLALNTRDHAYQPSRVEALAKDDPAAAQMNADSYEYFAEFLPR
jgi:peptidyl-Lys metalloendopeptidase